MIPKQLVKLKFCRIKKGTKRPFEKDWVNKPYSYEKILKFFPKENYGVICGYDNLAVIDCDNEALEVAIDSLLPKTFKVKTGKGSHFYYFIPNLKSKIILEVDNQHLGEVQSYGTQVVGANCIHPSKKRYEVVNDMEIKQISLEELYSVIKNFMKEVKETEKMAKEETKLKSEIDDLSVANIWGLIGLKKHKDEYYGEHPIHGSESGMNFWINPSKNTWHCFRCNSGGGPLSAIAVKEGIIDCSEANRGSLRGAKALESIKVAEEKYGLVKKQQIKEKKEDEEKREVKIIWDKDLQNYEEAEIEWTIEKWLPNRSVGILTGKRGTMKTFIALLMAYSIASGNKFLEQFQSTKGKVIYLDKENGISIMKKRTRMIKKGLEIDSDPIDVGFICFSTLKIDKLKDITKLRDILLRNKPRLLIIDTYRRGISFDENDAGAVSQLFVDILRPLSEVYNMSILLIHHDRKGQAGESGDEMDEIRGSSDLANYADFIMKTEKKGEFLILKQLKNRNAAEEKPLKIKQTFNEDLLNFEYLGEYEKKTKIDRCSEAILIWISKEGIEKFKTKDILNLGLKEGFKKNAIHSSLIELQNRGIIENVGFGLYKVISA